MDKEREFLPIGSVVQLEDSTALVMISGFLPMTSDPESIWDYSGFRYPLGYTDDDDIFCFNQDQIQVVYAYGYRDVEHDLFMNSLSDSLEEIRERMQNAEIATEEATKGDEEE